MTPQHELLMTVAVDAYRSETDVGERLTTRAEKYIAAVSVIYAINASAVASLTFTGRLVQVIGSAFLLAGIALLGLVIVLCIHGMRLRVYPAHAASEQLRHIVSHEIESADATFAVAKMYLEMRDAAAQVNQKVASELQRTTLFLVIGILLDILGFILLRVQR